MKKVLTVISLSAVVFLGSSGVFASEQSSISAPKTMAVPLGDAQRGESLAATCSACHGRQGNSTISAHPKLAGQGDRYLLKQMQDYKTGVRHDPIMSAQVANYSDQDLKDIASYFAAQEVSLGITKVEFAELGQKIYRGGNPGSGVTACIACHGPAGKGMNAAGFPALNGQHPEYSKMQLRAFRAAGRGDHEGKKRSNDSVDGGAAMMQDVAAKMSDDEIEAVSSYLYGLR